MSAKSNGLISFYIGHNFDVHYIIWLCFLVYCFFLNHDEPLVSCTRFWMLEYMCSTKQISSSYIDNACIAKSVLFKDRYRDSDENTQCWVVVVRCVMAWVCPCGFAPHRHSSNIIALYHRAHCVVVLSCWFIYNLLWRSTFRDQTTESIGVSAHDDYTHSRVWNELCVETNYLILLLLLLLLSYSTCLEANATNAQVRVNVNVVREGD